MSLVLAEELKSIYRSKLIWFTLASLDIKLKYRRSIIGPFWLTISMAVTIYTMGFLYAHLFRVDVSSYFPYLAAGIIIWALISSLIIDSSQSFVESAAYIKNQYFDMSIFIMKTILKNFIIFFHNLLAFIPILFIFHVGLNINILMIIPGLILIIFNGYFWGGIIAILGTRYGDFDQIIKSIVQVVFFITPIMWTPSLLPERYQWAVNLNPFSHILGIIRNPLLGKNVEMNSFLIVLLISMIGMLLFNNLTKKFKYRIVYWL